MRSRRWGLWAWGVTAPVILVALVVMWAEPGACDAKLISNTASAPSANCFEFWLNRYQTMISGLLALSAAVAAYLAAKLQIGHIERLEEKRRQAEENAARARLSFALKDIMSYAASCMTHFLTRLETPNDRSPLFLSPIPANIIDFLQNCVRFADEEHSKKIGNLLAFLLFFESTLRGRSRCHTMAVYQIVINAMVL